MNLTNFTPIELELERNPSLNVSDIRLLRDWLIKQPHLPSMTDSDLALFLHYTNYSVEIAKQKIDMYFTLRTHIPEVFGNRDPVKSKGIRQSFETVLCLPLEQKSKSGDTVFYMKLLDYDSSKYDMADSLKTCMMSIDLSIALKGSSFGHCIFVCDMTGATMGHMAKLNPSLLKKQLRFSREGAQIEIAGIHLINPLPITPIFVRLMKPFAESKDGNRMHVHSDIKTLWEFIPEESLPYNDDSRLKEANEKHIKSLEDHRNWFLNGDQLARVNEELRPGKSKTAADLFGIEGTFKQLEVD